jgi:hypothetical protein
LEVNNPPLSDSPSNISQKFAHKPAKTPEGKFRERIKYSKEIR